MHVASVAGKLSSKVIVIRSIALNGASVISLGKRMAGDNARVDFGITGWSPEFSAWYDERREQYLKETRDYLNEDATNDEINEEIQNEPEAWND